MSVNLIDNHSFELGLTEWSTSGDVTASAVSAPFERSTVADLGGPAQSQTAIISQLVHVPDEATHFHVVYAVRPSGISVGNLQVQVEFRGSANLVPPLPLLRRDVIDVIDPGALVNVAWETRYAVTGEIPAGTEWARLRFLHEPDNDGALLVDAVYMTTD